MIACSLLPTPTEMVAHLDRFVRGQKRAKQDLAVAVYNHYLSQAYREREGVDLGRYHVLLLGPTGVGKTYMAKTLAQFLSVPVGFTSAAGLVEAGYKGNSVESVVRNLMDRAGGDPRKAEKGIVFLDEIDKIRSEDNGGVRDVSGEGVQNGLLTLLDGRTSDGIEGMNHSAVDTGRILFICAGAFVGLQAIIERRLGTSRHPIGFRPRAAEQVEKLPDLPLYSALCQAQTCDLVSFGMIPEFIGRFATLTVVHELSRTDLRDILGGQTERSPLELQRKLAAIHGIDLVFTSDALDALSEEAAALGTGARGLHRLMCRAVESVDHRWAELADGGVRQVVVNSDCIVHGSLPELRTEGPAAERIDQELRRSSLSGLPPRPKPVLAVTQAGAQLPPGVTDTSGWSDEQLWNSVEQMKAGTLGWKSVSESARKWWTAFETENMHRPALIHRLAEELKNRNATITEFFLAYVYSSTDNIQANLHYLDYMRLKSEEDKRSKK